mgnify:CR=1 FL=1
MLAETFECRLQSLSMSYKAVYAEPKASTRKPLAKSEQAPNTMLPLQAVKVVVQVPEVVKPEQAPDQVMKVVTVTGRVPETAKPEQAADQVMKVVTVTEQAADQVVNFTMVTEQVPTVSTTARITKVPLEGAAIYIRRS